MTNAMKDKEKTPEIPTHCNRLMYLEEGSVKTNGLPVKKSVFRCTQCGEKIQIEGPRKQSEFAEMIRRGKEVMDRHQKNQKEEEERLRKSGHYERVKWKTEEYERLENLSKGKGSK